MNGPCDSSEKTGLYAGIAPSTIVHEGAITGVSGTQYAGTGASSRAVADKSRLTRRGRGSNVSAIVGRSLTMSVGTAM